MSLTHNKIEVAAGFSVRPGAARATNAGASVGEVLTELYRLLEDYGPYWYTQEQHERTLGVLRALGLRER
jgi:hypothetical protein